ncbi:MAG TPA: flagellar biosynthesis regulator FlaF [Stellaceae bacterium]|nr:flagellar biosynthesis regulator FlaF [Stellaceae bacterium]
MNLAAKRYQRLPESGNPARTEAWALIEMARELHQSKEASLDARRAALRKNWRLWTIFQAGLLDPDCTVPAETRSNLLGLANFIDRHTAALLADGDPIKIDVLVKINRQISEGLLDGQRATAQPGQAPAAPPAALAENI